MPGFNVLDPSLSIFENRFLEASAGTGKTFTIENLVIRLLNEKIPFNQILIVTFTRAATFELKERIRARLSSQHLLEFDQAKIWTIHSFCLHCLQEHAFHTAFTPDQVEESAQSDLFKEIIKDSLRTTKKLTPKQLEKVIQDSLINRLVNLVSQRLPIEQPNWEFPKFEVNPDQLFEDLIHLAPQYKNICDKQKRIKPENIEGLKRFTKWINGEKIDPVDLPILNYAKENISKRKLSIRLNYPGLLEKMQEELIPKLASFSDPTHILAVLADEARLHVEKVIKKEDLVFFEDLLKILSKQVEDFDFAQLVRQQYRAVLIDEFQDTDPIQWKIFSTLFLNQAFEGPVYLVGDPKQSIYRFRSADLYTYIEAKKAMGEKAYASLATNYRSTPSLVGELNDLFSQPFITLPKTQEAIFCRPVEAASKLEPILDGKGSLHFLFAEEEEILFSTIVHEVANLNLPLREIAVLVSDRYQAERFMNYCSLPCISKSSRSLIHSPAFPTLIELIRAVQNPRDRSAIAQVFGGPLFRFPIDALPKDYASFYDYHDLLKKEGLLSLFNRVIEDSNLSDPFFYQEMLQLVKMGLHIKKDYLFFYRELMSIDPDSEKLKVKMHFEEEAIQVMTIHVSKGLEFSVVFPIGIATPYKHHKGLVRCKDRFVISDELSREEERSEKMRQIYVACTRAKKRVYIPVLKNDSPISTFLNKINLSEKSQEICRFYPPPIYKKPPIVQSKKIECDQTYSPLAIHSYSSLFSYEPVEKTIFSEDSMPGGAQTGVLIHQLFEEVSFDCSDLNVFVQKKLYGTFLEGWSDEITAMLDWALDYPLPNAHNVFSLRHVNQNHMIKEMEFLFPSQNPPGFFKGFIDLFFKHAGSYYLIDWKTNLIDTSVEEVIHTHRYDLQAQIYQEAIQKYLRLFDEEANFQGIFYFFLRPRVSYQFFNGSLTE
ncbi:MAG: UvrD-helicase domain-containing protein [Chlamydiales bacterium]